MLSQFEGVLPNVHLDACTREQLQAAHPDRFFPCADDSSTTAPPESSQHQLDAESIAGLQQGTAAWHQARSCHISGSILADILGFSCPAANRVLCRQQVYHAVPVGPNTGYHKLLHCIGSLRADPRHAGSSSSGSAAAAPAMEPFGQLACTWGSQHEAAAHHTLLQHAPPGSLLIDTGFVSPAFEADAAFLSSIFAATPANAAIGSLGDIDPQSVRELRLGCSLDGLLLTPSSNNSNNDSGSTGGTNSSSSGRQRQQQQQQLDPSSIRRAPPYKWARDAGYTVSCVEVKCPTPFWSVKDTPWAFACASQDRNRPYLRMRAGHYCQSQLSMLVTGTECCVYVVWTRGRTWITHVPINRAWLHTCLHLLLQVYRRYVAPDSFTPPPTSLFWDPKLLPDGTPELSNLYRRFVEATAVLSASITSSELPDPLAWVPWGLTAPQQQQAQQQPESAEAAQQQQTQQQQTQQPAAAPAPPPGWHVNSSGRPLAHWVVLDSLVAAAAVGSSSRSRASAAAAAAAEEGGAPQAAAAAADTAATVGYGFSPMHTCMVKSLSLPQALQQPLQQDRWFLDRLDPDSTLQSHHLGTADAWLEHPLLDGLCAHPEGVQALLQRLHTGLSPMHLQAVAAAAAGGAGAGAGGSSSSSGARGLSPGVLVLAVLLKMEKLSCLDLSPLWKQLPQSALEFLQVWRATAQHRASKAAADAAASATAAAVALVAAQHSSQPSHGAATPPAAAAAAAAETADTDTATPTTAAAAVAASTTTNHNTSSSGSGRQAVLAAGGWAGAWTSWRQRQHLRQQQVVATLRRCIGSGMSQQQQLQQQQQQQQQQPHRQHAGRARHTSGSSSSRLAMRLQGLGLADLLQASSGHLAAAAAAVPTAASAVVPSSRGHSSMIMVVAAAAAAAAVDDAPEAPQATEQQPQQERPAQQRQQQLQQKQQKQRQRQRGRSSRVLPPPARQQQHAQRLVAAAQQQRRTTRLERYQAAFRAWPLVDMLSEVSHMHVEQQPLAQPLHELLQPILDAHAQAEQLVRQAAAAQQEQQQELVQARLRPVARRQATVVAAAAAGAGAGAGAAAATAPDKRRKKQQQQPDAPTASAAGSVEQPEAQLQQQQQASRAQPRGRPRKPKPEQAVAAAGATGGSSKSSSRSRRAAAGSQPLQPGAAEAAHVQPEAPPPAAASAAGTSRQPVIRRVVSAGGEAVAAAAAAAAAAGGGVAAFMVVAPAAVAACAEQQ